MILHDVYTALISGIVHRTENEIHWRDELDRPITIELLDNGQYIRRGYYKDGKKYWKARYENDQPHGECMGWYMDGTNKYEIHFKYGKLHGKCQWWYRNGNKKQEIEYCDGRQHGKHIWFDENGNKEYEHEFDNGRMVNQVGIE